MNSNSNPASQGQDSSQGDSWAKLISFGPGIENVNLYKPSYTIGRGPTNDIKIPDIKLSGVHCKIEKDAEGNFWVEDSSSNGTFIDNELIGKGKRRKINSGDKIMLLHHSKVKATEVIGFVFSANVKESNDLKRVREEDLQKLEEEKQKQQKQQKFQDQIGEEMMCCICIEVIYNCVSAIPCLHNFCAACFSDWMKKSKNCPQCREVLTEVKKNATVNNIIEKFLQSNPEKKRTKEEYDEMDQKNTIKEDRVVFNKPPAAVPVVNYRANVSLFNPAPVTGGIFNNRVQTNNRNWYNTANRYDGRYRRRDEYNPSEDEEESEYSEEEESESESEENSDEYD